MYFEYTDLYLIAHDVQVNNATANVVIERKVLPHFEKNETQLADWVVKHALAAVRNNDMGDHRYPNFYQNNQCGWIYRIYHNNGDISINEAPGN